MKRGFLNMFVGITKCKGKCYISKSFAREVTQVFPHESTTRKILSLWTIKKVAVICENDSLH